MLSKLKLNKKQNRYLILGIILLLLISISGGVCFMSSVNNKRIKKIGIIQYPEKMLPPAPQTKYYCIDRFSVYAKQKKILKGDWNLLHKYYMKNHDSNYDFKWYQRGKGWYLDTSSWKFVATNKKNKQVAAKIIWPKSPCSVFLARKQISCPVVLFNGLLWKVRFSPHGGEDGEFVKILLYRVPVSDAAKRRQRLAKLLGVKEINDIDICFREGPSPLKEIFDTVVK